MATDLELLASSPARMRRLVGRGERLPRGSAASAWACSG